MKLYNKIIDYLTDPSIPLDTRCFALTSYLCAATLALIFIWDVIIGETTEKLIMLGGAAALLFAVVFISLKTNRIFLGALIVSLGVIFIVLPVEFFTGGGVYGCTPIWYAFAFLFIGLNVTNKWKYPLIILIIVSAVTCYLVAYFVPGFLTVHDMKTAYLDSIASLVCVGLLMYLMMRFIIGIYIKERKLAQNQTAEIEKLNKAQNNFFSSMSHEIRTPINTIIGLNEMILREDISDEVAEDAKNIQSASKMLLHLINDILDMSKIESGKMELTPVSYHVGDMLSDIVGILWIRAKEKGLEFHIDVDPMMPAELYGDEVRIKQILINVLTNSVKYTKEGSVTLSISHKKLDERRVMVTYSISDTGIGIKKESIPHLFSAFKRVDETKNRYIEGTGLGLSIVKQLVDIMGGEITVNSVYMQGTTFNIEIPQEVVAFDAIGSLEMEKRHSMNHRNKYHQKFEAPDARLLVVDDNSANLLVVTKLLRDTKIKIDTAESGLRALELTMQNHYHAIFMDHMMPEMDGISAFHAIRNQMGGLCKETPVTVLTANAGSENQALYTREGFDGYLLKPVTGDTLESELIRILPKELVHVTDEEVLFDESDNIRNERHKKLPIIITTESVCDLPRKLVESKGIGVIPFHVKTEEGEFLDGKETDSRALLTYMQDGGKNARSIEPPAEEYEAFFARELKKANNIIHISITSKTSKAYEKAMEAAASFDNVTVIDSQHLSSGLGFLVLAAQRYAEADMSVEMIEEKIIKMRKHVHTSFIVDDTDFMARAGRLSSGVDTIARTLMIHPVLALKKGNLSVGEVHIGSQDASRKKYINKALDTIGTIKKDRVFVTYCGLDSKEKDRIKKMILSKVKFKEVIFQMASPAISANCGPGTFGVIYMTEER